MQCQNAANRSCTSHAVHSNTAAMGAQEGRLLLDTDRANSTLDMARCEIPCEPGKMVAKHLTEHPMPSHATGSLLTHLECPKTGETYDADTLQNLSRAGAPLLARYDLGRAAHTPDDLKAGPASLWRYARVL